MHTARAALPGLGLVVMLAVPVPAPADAPARPAGPFVHWQASGDGIAEPLGGLRGDAARGRAIVADRQLGQCLLCHSGPVPEERFQGNLAPPLDGAGARATPAQLRLRLADPQRLNPDSVMPAYHRIDGLQRVAPAWRGRPMLDAQQIEDVVAWLATLR